MRDDRGLSPRQMRLIACLLGSVSVGVACRKAGVNESTYYRWMKDSTFRDALYEAEREAIQEISRRLISGSDLALNTLQRLIIEADRASVKRGASNDWLNHTERMWEVATLIDRVEKLLEVNDELQKNLDKSG